MSYVNHKKLKLYIIYKSKLNMHHRHISESTICSMSMSLRVQKTHTEHVRMYANTYAYVCMNLCKCTDVCHVFVSVCKMYDNV